MSNANKVSVVGGTTSPDTAVTASNPFPVAISGGVNNSSVGPTGSTAPTSATEIGIIDGSGNLQGVSASNPLPISGSISASLSGFTPNGSVSTPLSVSNSSANVALPTGTVVAATNVGATAVYVLLGTSNAVTATTSDIYISAGGSIGLTVGANTYLAAITASATSTVNIAGGTGLLTGIGGSPSISGSNPAAGSTGSAVPASASYDGLNVSGTLRGQTGVNPSGAVYAAQSDITSVGGTTVSASSGIQNIDAVNFPATVDVNAGAAGANTVRVVIATGGATPLPTGAATSANQSTEITALGTINTTLGSPMQTSGGSVTANAGTNLNTSALATSALQTSVGATAHTDSGTLNTSLGTINTTLGSPMQTSGGSVTANAGTNLNTSALATSANQPTNSAINATTSGQTGTVVMGAVTTSAPTYTTAKSNPLSLDTAGNLRVNVMAGGGSGGTSSNFSATFPSVGTAIGASDGANMQPLLVDGSGYLEVNVKAGGGTGGTSSSFGAAVPATGTAIGASDGTNMQLLHVDGSGNLKVNVESTTGVAQDSTTSGQTLSPVGGAVTTSPPTYTTAKTDMLSLDTAGNLRAIINTGSTTAVTQTTASNLNATVSIASAQTLATLTGITNDVNVLPATDVKVTGAASATNNSSTSLVGAVSSKRLYITGYSLSNTSATTITVAFQDGSGGTTLWTQIVPAGGGANISGHQPLFWTTSGNALYFAASTGETTIYANAAGFSGS